MQEEKEVPDFKELDQFQKLRIYMDFLVEQKAFSLEYCRGTRGVISFEDFCNEKDDRKSEGLIGWYNRFKKVIFKTCL